ncbi:MAG TPA: HAD-IA family hydrolase, partial [Planctomycetaceae bacterium]|nr:HAD-IA family hydrolase [Planctomycetaceae bacterium]
ATGAIGRIGREMLDVVGLTDRFATIVSADDVARHKPAPDTYLEAARRLGIPPSECLVYEDTDPGLKSGRAAGMEVVDVREFFTPRRIT